MERPDYQTEIYRQVAVWPTEKLLAELETSAAGLTQAVAAQRRTQVGDNVLRSRETTGWDIFIRQFRSAFIYLLLIAAAVAFLLGEPIDGGMILVFVVLNSVLGYSQEYHSEHSLRLLRHYWHQTVHALREGLRLVDSRELVPGDLISLQAGDKITADVRFISADGLTIDESVLTGESISVNKTAGALARPPGAYHQAANIGFSGTSVLSGSGQALVFATGNATVIGGIAKLAVELKRESAFEKSLKQFGGFILKLVVITLVVLFLLNLVIKGGQTSVGEQLLFAIALAVSVIPEALPLVTTLSLSRGALRLAKQHVVIKRLSAIEDLGSIDVLCTDKTGTITENSLRVVNTRAADARQCLLQAVLASAYLGENVRGQNNAFDLALWQSADESLRQAALGYRKLGERPFDPNRRRNSVVVELAGERILIVRGAPESILPLCRNIDYSVEQGFAASEGRRGRRVIAIALRKVAANEAEPAEMNLGLVGQISFADPLKSDTLDAVKAAQRLGVSIKLLTGDAPEVAGAVAKEVGIIDQSETVLTGEIFARLPAAEQAEAVEKFQVFARLSPEAKHHILKLLQHKHTVGFLGEGFNDAPALKSAHVALAVDRASEVTKDAADVVLLDRSLMTIINGIEEGRRIFANTVKYIKNTLTSNFGNFYAIALVSLIIPFLPMLPIQILFVNLLSDFPMIAVATDSVERAELRRPRRYEIREIALFATFLGLVSTLFDFTFFAFFQHSGEATLQTLWFIESILTELALIYSIRTHGPFFRGLKPSRPLVGFSLAAILITVGLPFLSFDQRLFHFIQPNLSQLALVLGIVAVYFVTTEIVKLVYYRMTADHDQSTAVQTS